MRVVSVIPKIVRATRGVRPRAIFVRLVAIKLDEHTHHALVDVPVVGGPTIKLHSALGRQAVARKVFPNEVDALRVVDVGIVVVGGTEIRVDAIFEASGLFAFLPPPGLARLSLAPRTWPPPSPRAARQPVVRLVARVVRVQVTLAAGAVVAQLLLLAFWH